MIMHAEEAGVANSTSHVASPCEMGSYTSRKCKAVEFKCFVSPTICAAPRIWNYCSMSVQGPGVRPVHSLRV